MVEWFFFDCIRIKSQKIFARTSKKLLLLFFIWSTIHKQLTNLLAILFVELRCLKLPKITARLAQRDNTPFVIFIFIRPWFDSAECQDFFAWNLFVYHETSSSNARQQFRLNMSLIWTPSTENKSCCFNPSERKGT